jgi:hypothetical protein
VILLTVGAVQIQGQGVRFSGEPTVGDRSIAWEWEPIPGLDPFFQGNTVLERVEEEVPIPVPGDAQRLLRPSPPGSLLYAVDNLDDRVYVFRADTGELQRILPAPPSVINNIDVHRSDLLVLGGLQDGRLAFWDLRPEAPEEPTIFAAQRLSCDHVRFLIESIDPEEQRFVTAGAEDTARVWSAPGSILRKIITSGNPVASLATTRGGAMLALGDPTGVIRIYEPLRGTFLERLDGHGGAITQMQFSNDQRRLVSLDQTGKILIWDAFRWGESLFEIQVGLPDDVILALRQPDAALIYALDTEGVFEIFDGKDGRSYRSLDLVPEGQISGGTLDPLGRTVFAGLGAGSMRVYRTGFCTPSPADTVCFGGYTLWRNESPAAEGADLLRVYGFGDSTWSFVGERRSFVDPDSLIPRGGELEEPLAGPHNGMPYYYSITAFKRKYLDGSVHEVRLNTIEEGFYRTDPTDPEAIPSPVRTHPDDRTELPLLGDVFVVPNPYELGNVPWDAELGEHVDFRNLPERATIRIYTIAGDLLRTIDHGGGDFGEPTDSRSWDLKNTTGEDVTSGVYIYLVTTPLSGEQAKGYFVLVR